MSKVDLTLHVSDVIPLHMPEGKRLEKALRSYAATMDVRNPANTLPEDQRLREIYKNCIEGNVINMGKILQAPKSYHGYQSWSPRGH